MDDGGFFGFPSLKIHNNLWFLRFNCKEVNCEEVIVIKITKS